MGRPLPEKPITPPDKSLRYPLSELNKSSDFLRIGIVDYVAPGFGSKDRETKKYYEDPNKKGSFIEITDNKPAPPTIKTTDILTSTLGQFTPGRGERKKKTKIAKAENIIFLPIPSNIQDGNSVSFGPGSMDGFTAQTLDYAMGLMTLENYKSAPQFLTEQVFGGALDTFANGKAKEFFLRNLATQAANIPFGGNLTASQLLARQTGQVLNPNMELLFEGVNLRSFKFSFKLTPRSGKEATTVKKIIRKLKESMAPAGDGTFFLETPKIFELTYMKGSGEHPFLHRFKQCALTDMSVNYTGEGTYATYGDFANPGAEGTGTPVSMIMDLSFKELEPIYRGDYSASDKTVGY